MPALHIYDYIFPLFPMFLHRTIIFLSMSLFFSNYLKSIFCILDSGFNRNTGKIPFLCHLTYFLFPCKQQFQKFFKVFFKYKFIYFNWRLITLQYCIGFAIYQHESTTGIHVLPILNPPPSSFPLWSLWVVPAHQPQASSIVHWTWTGDSFHIWYYACFNAILPNHPTLALSH